MNVPSVSLIGFHCGCSCCSDCINFSLCYNKRMLVVLSSLVYPQINSSDPHQFPVDDNEMTIIIIIMKSVQRVSVASIG